MTSDICIRCGGNICNTDGFLHVNTGPYNVHIHLHHGECDRCKSKYYKTNQDDDFTWKIVTTEKFDNRKIISDITDDEISGFHGRFNLIPILHDKFKLFLQLMESGDRICRCRDGNEEKTYLAIIRNEYLIETFRTFTNL